MDKKIFLVSGMHCNSCAQLIEINLEELPGINSVKIDYAAGKAIVEFDNAKISETKIIESIKKAGYDAKSD